MQESYDRNATSGRDADATSKETLEDLEQSEKVSDTNSAEESTDSIAPSPDGSGDESHERADDAGPM
jgi:hypothetical protein